MNDLERRTAILQNKVMISVAPVPAAEHLIDPVALAEDVHECYRQGASMVHLHVRDRMGRLTEDVSELEKTVGEIKKRCDIVIEVSTGGVSDLSIKQRVVPCHQPWVEAVSLNVGSVNLGEAVYQNPIADVRFCVETIAKTGKIPETELFEVGMANTLRELCTQYKLPVPRLIALVVGHPGEMPATPAGLRHLIDGVYDNFEPGEVIWGFTQAHRRDWSMMEYALKQGAQTLRVGFEDSDYLDAAHRTDRNAPLIEVAARLVRDAGKEPMKPEEVRKILGIIE